jgi:hypothetical protein
VFGVGFLFSDDIKNLAKEFPNQRFACIDYTWSPGDSVPANLVGLEFREEEGSFLVGALAALTSKSGKVGFVGGMDIPLIRKFEAGYTAGARAVNPNVVVVSKYAGTTGAAFKDPTKGKELALAEYQDGVDVIFHASGSTGLGVFEAARELKKLAIGVDADQYDEAPGFILTSMVKRVDHAVFDTIRDLKAGQWQGGVREMGLAEHGVTWVYDDRNKALIPDHVKATVDSARGRDRRRSHQGADRDEPVVPSPNRSLAKLRHATRATELPCIRGRVRRRRARSPLMSAWTVLGDGVSVRRSRCFEMNTLVAQRDGHTLLIDPGVLPSELDELVAMTQKVSPDLNHVSLAFTHPHWDHVLGLPWFPVRGDVRALGLSTTCSSRSRSRSIAARARSWPSTARRCRIRSARSNRCSRRAARRA